MRFLLSYGVAFLLLVGIGGWMASGYIVQGGQGPGNGETQVLDAVDLPGADKAKDLMTEFGLIESEEEANAAAADAQAEAEAEQAAADELQSVRTRTFTVEALPLEVTLRGNTKAKATVSIRAETTGILEKRHVEKGDVVEAGELLCTLDAGTREARLAQAEARYQQALADFETNKKLREKELAPTNTAAAFESSLKAAKAQLDEAKAELERTEIYAEAGGIVQDPMAQPGDMLSAGGTCVTLVQLNPLVFVGDVAESRIDAVRIGLPVTVKTVTGREVEGKVSYISPTANTATRAFPVEVELPNPNNDIRAGLTAEASAVLGSVPAHLVPQSVLTLDNDGTLGVRVVETGDKVAFYPVQIVRDSQSGIWVTGLPERVDIITVGQEYVVAGQQVVADNVSEETTS
ncbi:efflux RND transporter periplasmic adaptor subunit [Maritalea mediterranea]|uniref:Efflux RND transporter periplasmic adaptor subunit n=1 Tax=Maritalea mediterranea TaxID=2909667 RepID=A0ABS9E5B2_9HYPH|nr:efflux RND transporter periplasmic adaptor subunit [Maritalea mediterranea]MCF4098044.1 efflux RND transporter periplasmic adaptor subunit [Maritalea mediterranea]